jgi:hypothetical protein
VTEKRVGAKGQQALINGKMAVRIQMAKNSRAGCAAVESKYELRGTV